MKEYIERDAVLDHALLVREDCDSSEAFEAVPVSFIKSLPTADVQEVRHGIWCHLGGDEWCCNCCGDIISTEGSWEKPEKKYCSECGAKMDRSEQI